MSVFRFIFISVFFISITTEIYCQNVKFKRFEADTLNWWKLDVHQDSIPGISWNKALQHLESLNKFPSAKIKIAVLDTDFNISNSHFQDLIWTNNKEISKNGKDDDSNGYVDDINGWSFLGMKSKDSSLAYVLVEEARMLNSFDSLSFYKHAKKNKLPFQFNQIRESYDKVLLQLKEQIQPYKDIETDYTFIMDTLHRLIKSKLTIEDLTNYLPPNDTIKGYVEYAKYYYQNGYPYDEFIDYLNFKEQSLEICMNLEHDNRVLIGDDINSLCDKYYGNGNFGSNVTLLEHGTLISGIIASSIKYSDSLNKTELEYPVSILPITFTGIGDFTDKDFYQAFYYAIENGAKIINLSQGKAFSTYPKVLLKALKEAERNNVLVVMSAGNNGENLDTERRFPQTIPRLFQRRFSNIIVVGASSKNLDENLIDEDSNYGVKTVDIMAPGVEIKTTSVQNEIVSKSGTSFSAPIVTNLAALLWSYYPDLTAKEIKKIIIDSGSSYELMVNVPSGDKSSDSTNTKLQLPFSQFTKSGKIINAFKAVVLAEKISQP